MSAAKMVADSTQDASDGKRRKKRIKKSGKKVHLPEDEDSDLDLKKDLKPISFYTKDRPKMIEEMFHSVKGASMQRALPELLKSIPMDELKLLCLEQLEVMSKKRLRRILAGEESANISSSGTDDDTSEEENQEGKAEDTAAPGQNDEEGPMADSTSIHQDSPQKSETDSEQVPANNEQSQVPEGFLPMPVEEIKQEPVDSEAEEEFEREAENDNYNMEDEEDEEDDDDEDEEEEEEEEEEPAEAYTSGSEDGELVKRDVVPKVDDSVEVKQEVFSDSEHQEGRQEDEMQSGGGDGKETISGAENQKVEELEGELLSSVETNTAGNSRNLVLPSIMMDQMELLELEMRARAIKAMLTSQEEEVEDG